MALSTIGYTASGAGTSAVNGNYIPVTGANATFNGVTQYTNGTYFLTSSVPNNGLTAWLVNPTANTTASASYDGNGSPTSFPLTGWVLGYGASVGVAPAPTFVAMGLPAGLVVSGLTGSGTSTASLNGTYALNAGVDGQGLQYYVENTGGNYLYYLNSQGSWWLNSTLDQVGSGWYKAGSAGTAPLGSGWTQAGNPAVWGGSGLTMGLPNPKVQINGALVSCPATGTINPTSNTWEVYNSGGTLIDSGGSGIAPGNHGLFYCSTPLVSGGAIVIQAYTGAVAATGYQFRSSYIPGPSSGPFDVVAAAPILSSLSGISVISGISSISF